MTDRRPKGQCRRCFDLGIYAPGCASCLQSKNFISKTARKKARSDARKKKAGITPRTKPAGRRKGVVYELFIVSAEWRDIRVRLWAEQGRFCAACGNTEDLHVHHMTYARLGGNELLSDLVGLCAACHSDVHDLHRAEGGSLQAFTEELVAARSGRVPGRTRPSPYVLRLHR